MYRLTYNLDFYVDNFSTYSFNLTNCEYFNNLKEMNIW